MYRGYRERSKANHLHASAYRVHHSDALAHRDFSGG